MNTQVFDYMLQITLDWQQLLVGVYYTSRIRVLYVGPLSFRWERLSPPDEAFREILEHVVGQTAGHVFKPDSDMPGKFVCEFCGEVAWNVPKELLN